MSYLILENKNVKPRAFSCISGLSLANGLNLLPSAASVSDVEIRCSPAGHPLAPQMPAEIADWPGADCVVMETDLSNPAPPPRVTSWRPQNKSWVVEKAEGRWLFAARVGVSLPDTAPVPSPASSTHFRGRRFDFDWIQIPLFYGQATGDGLAHLLPVWANFLDVSSRASETTKL